LSRALSREVFLGHEGSTFTVVGTGIPGAMDRAFGPVDLELADVEDRSNDVVDAVSILFRGPREQEFGQANYRLKHEALGEIDLFLVPILDPRPRDDRICYQAVINRLKE
jgi:hypothetical protein